MFHLLCAIILASYIVMMFQVASLMVFLGVKNAFDPVTFFWLSLHSIIVFLEAGLIWSRLCWFWLVVDASVTFPFFVGRVVGPMQTTYNLEER